MKRRALFAVVVALAACRGVIGVEDLKLDAGADGGTTPPPGTPPPGTPPPGTPPPGTPPPPPVDAGNCPSAMPCQKCCRDAYSMTPEEMALDQKLHSCICNGGECGLAASCGSANYCGGGVPDMQCAHDCIDPALFDASCPAVRDCKAAGSGCEDLAACIAKCPPLM